MGYCINLRETTASFKVKNAKKVLKAIQNLKGKESIEDGSGRHFSWVSNSFNQINDIVEMFDEWRWGIKQDGEDYKISYFTGEKYGDDNILFEAIALYMNDGYIEMQGEDGLLWRWIFEDGKFKEISPNIEW